MIHKITLRELAELKALLDALSEKPLEVDLINKTEEDFEKEMSSLIIEQLSLASERRFYKLKAEYMKENDLTEKEIEQLIDKEIEELAEDLKKQEAAEQIEKD